MKNLKLILILAVAPFSRRRFTTANVAASAASGELSDIQARLDALESENAALKAQASGAQPADPLGLGALQLPKGVEVKDVQWRKEAGLTIKQAVAAAFAQVRFNAKKAAGALKKKGERA